MTDVTIPTDEAGLYTFIAGLSPVDRAGVADQLTRQTGRDWASTVTSTMLDIENAEQCEVERQNLRDALKEAEQAIHNVVKVRQRLFDLYDVEYAEGGDLFHEYLSDAYKAVRTAAAVNPCREG